MGAKIKISDFYNNEYIDSATYTNYRSLANFIDGLKPSSRKVVYTFDRNNIKQKIKVSQAQSKVAEFTQYLHGENSLNNVIVGMAQTFTGSNNINLLEPEGNFGSRFIPEASANRYIYTMKSNFFEKIMIKDDNKVLIKQSFEGEEIEPRFYVPILPLVLVNGTAGVGYGFCQKILPRNPKKIAKEITNYLEDKAYKIKPIPIYYRNYGGTFNKLADGSIEICGAIKKLQTNIIAITEVPITYDLKAYLKVLDKLEEDKVIKNYQDKSEGDRFSFIITTPKEFYVKDEKEILTELKLIKKATEIFVCLDQENKIKEFNNERDLLEAYIKIRLDFYQKRKDFLLSQLKKEVAILTNKMLFINCIVTNKLKPNTMSIDQLTGWLEKEGLPKVNGSYNYLVDLPMVSLTLTKLDELKQKISTKEQEAKALKETTIEKMWTNELQSLNI